MHVNPPVPLLLLIRNRESHLITNASSMKLIITGASGFVATEVLRQALLQPSITSIVAVARSSISSPEGTPAASASKLKSVVVPDYGTYPEDVKKELAGADACIWYVGLDSDFPHMVQDVRLLMRRQDGGHYAQQSTFTAH